MRDYFSHCTSAGVTHAQLTELAYIVACCLHDGDQPDLVLDALESQLDIPGSQARTLKHMAKSAGMMPCANATKECPALTDFMVCLFLYF